MEPFTSDEVTRLRELLEVEAIRKTRLAYSHLMDAGRIDELAEIFTEDALCEFGPYGTWRGRETIRANYHAIETGPPFMAMHATCDHLVELTGPDTAIGRAYLLEPMTSKSAQENPFIYLGLYDEAYRKVDGRWLIERCSLEFFWPERHLTEGFPGQFGDGQ